MRTINWKRFHKEPWWHKEMRTSLKLCLKYYRQGNEKAQIRELTNIMYHIVEQMRNF